MTVQTSYFNSPDLGFPGQLMYAGQPHKVYPYWAEEDLPAGRGVAKGTDTVQTANNFNDHQIPFGAVLPSADTDVLLGISIRTVEQENDANGEPFTPDEGIVNVLQEGAVLVTVGEAVSPRDPVYVIFDNTNVTGLAAGEFVMSDDISGAEAGAVAIVLPNAYFHNAAAAGGRAVVVIATDPAV